MHLHNFYVFPMGYFVLCVPHPLFIFGFQHFISFNHFIFLIAPVLCSNSLNLWPYLFFFFLKQTQESLYNMLQERTKRNREKVKMMENNKLKFTDNLYKRNTSVQTSENDVSKSISIFTFIKELYNSIIVQIPASISKGCEVQEKRQQEVNQQEQGCVSSSWPGQD